jgi:putative ABC transport system permease protein
MSSYTLSTLWHERQRYLPGVGAVGFSALLISLQCGLLLGLFSITSIPIDHSSADVWVGAPSVLSVDVGRAIPESYLARVAREPEVKSAEVYFQGFAYWTKPSGGNELCIVIGSRLGDGAIGLNDQLTPEMRVKLMEPGAIVVDESELGRLGVKKIGDTAEISGQQVQIVGLVKGMKSIAGPYIFTSIDTARPKLRIQENQTTYVLAKCHEPAQAPALVKRLKAEYPDMATFTSWDFSVESRMHWLTKTKAGIAFGYAALLGLMVGAIVTSQTLYGAVAASLREYAVLRALGIPRWRMGLTVITQSFWVGILGVVGAIPVVHLLARLADLFGAKVMLPWQLLAIASAVTMVMAMISGLFALRSLRLVEPAVLLR